MDLSTSYLGLKLAHPLVPSASPLTYSLAGIRRLEDAGAPAVVLYSLFEEQISRDSRFLDYYLSELKDYEERMIMLPDASAESDYVESYLKLVRDAKEAVDIPIIASLNGVTPGGWTRYACDLEQAGADALELNIYYLPSNLELTSEEVESTYFQILRDVKEYLTIPLAVKLCPYFSAPGNMALRLAKAGADGLVLFNRFYQPDFDIETRQVNLELSLSQPAELRLPLRWAALLYGRTPADLAITGGIQDAEDVIKAMMAGAKVAMVTSELLRHGVKRLAEMLSETRSWLETHGHGSLHEIQGVMSQLELGQPEVFERANYIKMLQQA